MTHLFKTISSALIAMLGIVIAFTASAGDIVLSLEEPANASYTGIANVKWHEFLARSTGIGHFSQSGHERFSLFAGIYFVHARTRFLMGG